MANQRTEYFIEVQRDGSGPWRIVPGAFYRGPEARKVADETLARLREVWPEDLFRLKRVNYNRVGEASDGGPESLRGLLNLD
jgi:hypothetical protein